MLPKQKRSRPSPPPPHRLVRLLSLVRQELDRTGVLLDKLPKERSLIVPGVPLTLVRGTLHSKKLTHHLKFAR
jgi:hypothetical protein